MQGQDTRRVVRERMQVDVSRALRAAMHDHDVSWRALAASCGVSKGLVQRWLDHEDPCQMGLHDLACAPADVARDVLRFIANQHALQIAGGFGDGSITDDLQHLAAVVRECGEATAVFAHAISDGHITPEQAAAIDRECSEAIAGLIATSNRAKEAKRAGDTVRRIHSA